MPRDPFEEETEEEREKREAAAAAAADAEARAATLDMKRSLEHDYVRRMLWRLIDVCGPFTSIWDPSGKIHYNAGRQDVGQHLLYKIGEADPRMLGQMIQEQYSQKQKESIR